MPLYNLPLNNGQHIQLWLKPNKEALNEMKRICLQYPTQPVSVWQKHLFPHQRH